MRSLATLVAIGVLGSIAVPALGDDEAEAILREYTRGYCKEIEALAPRIACVKDTLRSEQRLILDKHEKMKQEIGIVSYARLYMDPSTGVHEEFRQALDLWGGIRTLAWAYCRALSDENQQRECIVAEIKLDIEMAAPTPPSMFKVPPRQP